MKQPVRANIEVVDNDNGTLNCLHGERTSVHESVVHYRGQSSLHFGKHQLAVKLASSEEFLGLPEERSFILNGPTVDGSLMRNHLGHWLYRGTGRWSPRTRHVVVFIRDRLDINDDTPVYKGIYLVLERIGYGPNRVGLAPLDSNCSLDELSGGWAWQINPLSFGSYSPNIVLDQYQQMFGAGERPLLMYPKGETLTQTMRDYFVDPATSPLGLLYQNMHENMTQPEQLEELLDLGSYVDYFLHSEMSQNQDAYRRSAYFFKDRAQPINAGPAWDLNLAYGIGAFAGRKDWIYKPFAFWKRLLCHHKFVALVAKRWRALRAGMWSDDTITAFIHDSVAPINRQLAYCHNWTTINLQCANVAVGNKGTYQQHIDKLTASVLARAKWMDENIAKFYAPLTSELCMSVGALPAFNCAADGDDDGCLTNPEKYIEAAEFPPVRQATTGGLCEARPTSLNTREQPSADPCWLSAGTYPTAGAITPFCSGYGYCDPGPGATCVCINGRKPPTCARSDAPIVKPTVLTSEPNRMWTSPLFYIAYTIALTVGVFAAVAFYHRVLRSQPRRLSRSLSTDALVARRPSSYGAIE
ncbi:TPA: hypothetical protein N0F65_005531 [Lagenidium giganteum]|uniref:Uncharacterized protein n=1 Tax=Lagenidium giganteum TaxID=4803 RepID=A0AAV2YYF4_9STRA|nr:TPA: hypothetical protein N0F65_005531 [Lagenidium giganteum]